ncbi:hypothetical protein TWF788_007177 [Orbilia oligospora]|uniref:Histidine acid phosphatase n=1 Tax=Orbilia oligospora TaxID=2813651 RepID=A0A6G1MNK2_ORBOL|nr:hypothetical protein TWF788_007177 [Orbilia oligospora]KAF3219903.1 hypothetical protein TWF679_010359 [Orbilia oligospora]KAF3221615.1 hypothetical protein TWF191_007118 [Orbilia oligospora]KAF3264273.1 hypothetical protein TWF192_003961 [Orbilia oligospora]
MKVSSIIASSSLLAATAYAQANKSPAVTSNGTVLSVFLFHNHCDRTSLILPDGSQGGTFGAGGATMCFQDGAYYWNKYLRKDAPLKIYGTSQIFNSDYVNAEVPNMDLSIQSAMAFLQGLYRPVAYQNTITSGNDILAADNSTFSNGPLNGFQYVPITTYRSTDPQSVWVAGNLQQCNNQKISSAQYYSSDDYKSLYDESKPFYDSLYEPYFQGVFEDFHMVFYYAYTLYDYVNQNREAGNTTLLEMSDEDFDQLHIYANHLQFNMYGNTTTSVNPNWASGDLTEDLRDVGGRLMAGKIARTFREQLASPGGWPNKFNFVLGGYDIMLSFFAIANLPSRSPDFFGLPDLGSSMVFELYTDDETVDTDHIVDQQSIKVAFGFRNGTTVDDTLTYWPLFDQDDGEFGMPYEKFFAKLDEVAVRSVGQWCSVCSAKLDFCQGTGPVNPPTGSNNDGQNDEQSSTQRHGMAPAVAGVIGAIIMLAIVGIVAALAFFVFGVGVRRERRRSSVLSGIGSIGRSQPKEKLESDIELPLSPTAQPLPRGFGEDNEFEYGTTSTVATKVASPLASPQEAHFKAWESRL